MFSNFIILKHLKYPLSVLIKEIVITLFYLFFEFYNFKMFKISFKCPNKRNPNYFILIVF